MSKNKIRNPKDKTPVSPIDAILGTGVDELVAEWRQISGKVAMLSQQMQAHQETQRKSAESIKQIENQGLQLVGQLQTLTKILNGMGITDPKTYHPPEEEISDENPPSEPENKAEVVDIKGDDPKKPLQSRFHRS